MADFEIRVERIPIWWQGATIPVGGTATGDDTDAEDMRAGAYWACFGVWGARVPAVPPPPPVDEKPPVDEPEPHPHGETRRRHAR